MKYLFLTIFTILIYTNRLIGQDFSVKLSLNKDIPNHYKTTYRPHILNDTKTLDKFVYDKKANDNISFFYYLIPSTNVRNELVTDTINAIVYIYPHETRLIIDENKDDNFRNDKTYLFNTPDNYFETDLGIQIDKYLDSNLDKKNFSIYPVQPKDEFVVTYPDKENKIPTFSFSTERNGEPAKLDKFKILKNWVYQGNFNLDEKVEIKITLREENQKPYLFEIKYKNIVSPSNRIGDTVLIEGNLYAMDGDQSNIDFKYIEPIEYNIFPAVNYINKEQLKEENFRGKYLLLDFWGSWCGLCIKGIPDLKKIREKYNQNLQIISIAYENNEDMSSLDRVLKEQQMDWPQVSYNRSSKNPNINGKKFKITLFPTFVLIDPEGKTILRTQALSGLDPIDEYLQRININD
ncbi:TlpA family protein disulfide reductase [Sphingobacterium faecale]|uniref:TlpA family protein disulfide reductase n=1 Tax=Sphingobacterium faecale TaxID=2803775 RepID=A0ABS1QZB7_9SPHI|nr:TlpA disulfide reductase family protein [Sphingobacterium faecale]MBL1407773.1 TlpA family protein disulfide reductase [Sphingobacterium faecale]